MKIIRGKQSDIGSHVSLLDYGDDWIIVEAEDGITRSVTASSVSIEQHDADVFDKDTTRSDLEPRKVRFWTKHEISGTLIKPRLGERVTPPPMTRHEFLAALHQILQPKLYLEIGVQHGLSLALAKGADYAIGIDPNPTINATGNQLLYRTTSDDYFANTRYIGNIDLAFIDGEHLAEFALRDFINVCRHTKPGSVVVLDDVLPFDSAIATRAMPPGGHWTGDVWKVWELLKDEPDINVQLVDTFPTGTMIVMNWEKGLIRAGEVLSERYPELEARIMQMGEDVPTGILDRRGASTAQSVLDELRKLCRDRA